MGRQAGGQAAGRLGVGQASSSKERFGLLEFQSSFPVPHLLQQNHTSYLILFQQSHQWDQVFKQTSLQGAILIQITTGVLSAFMSVYHFHTVSREARKGHQIP